MQTIPTLCLKMKATFPIPLGPVVQKAIRANPGLNILIHGLISKITETDLICEFGNNKFFLRKI